jgi:hypothetical protein
LRLAGTEIVVRQLADGSYENIETFDRVEIDGKKLEVSFTLFLFLLLM